MHSVIIIKFGETLVMQALKCNNKKLFKQFDSSPPSYISAYRLEVINTKVRNPLPPV